MEVLKKLQGVSIAAIRQAKCNGFIDKAAVPTFIDREKSGTDVCILGYSCSDGDQPWNVQFQRHIMDNYFAAIYDNELIVQFKDKTEDEILIISLIRIIFTNKWRSRKII